MKEKAFVRFGSRSMYLEVGILVKRSTSIFFFRVASIQVRENVIGLSLRGSTYQLRGSKRRKCQVITYKIYTKLTFRYLLYVIFKKSFQKFNYVPL